MLPAQQKRYQLCTSELRQSLQITWQSVKKHLNIWFIVGYEVSLSLRATDVRSSHSPTQGSSQLRYPQAGGQQHRQSNQVPSRASQNSRVKMRRGKQYKTVHSLKWHISYCKDLGTFFGKSTHTHIKVWSTDTKQRHLVTATCVSALL